MKYVIKRAKSLLSYNWYIVTEALEHKHQQILISFNFLLSSVYRNEPRYFLIKILFCMNHYYLLTAKTRPKKFFFFFSLYVCFLKLETYILTHIPLCGQVSDKNCFTWLISWNKNFFGIILNIDKSLWLWQGLQNSLHLQRNFWCLIVASARLI